MYIKNPIIPGFYPDPSICVVEGVYYTVHSSFEYFPSLPIFESRDLMHWKPIGHVLESHNRLTLMEGCPNRTGMYAPTIRYHEGTFYVVCTNVAYGDEEDGNFIVYASHPKGPWSAPRFIELPGIDPSLFFDEDGSVYYTGTHGGIYLCKFDVHTGKCLEQPQSIWSGTGGCAPEGPHLYKRDGWYYLMLSEGGTEYGHMVTIARSLSPYGPYESYSDNPILTHRSLEHPIRATGHADMFCDVFGQWWAVCLGIRPISYPNRHNLGRETFLVPVEWVDGWPVMGEGKTVALDVHLRRKCVTSNDERALEIPDREHDDFTKTFSTVLWNTLYKPLQDEVVQGEEGLSFYGTPVTLSEAKPLSWMGKRQRHHNCVVQTLLAYDPRQIGDEAGLTVYMNYQHHYEVFKSHLNGKNCLVFRRQLGTLVAVEAVVPCENREVYLRVEASETFYTFSYRIDELWHEIGRGETAYLTTEVGGCFTGNYLALYACSKERSCKQPAVFKWFEYSNS